MKIYILLIWTAVILIPAYSFAQTDAKHTEDEKAIRQIVQNVTEAWAAGDGVKYADNFTDDVDYTVWNGHRINGREENIKGHQEIFDTFYKGTNVQFEITKLRFLSDDVATVHLRGKMYRNGQRVEDVPTVVPLMVLKKENGSWKITVFQNTPIIKRGELQLKQESEK
jgi:uncharacterized protein (TIGR02246 family)